LVIPALTAQKGADLTDEDFIRHVTLNSLRMYNKKYRERFGQMVIACDAGNVWRKKYYAEYKWSRKVNREKDQKTDWKAVFVIVDKIRQELIENFHYKVVHVDTAEADDIIGVLVETTQEFGQCEDVMIVSSDKDFAQLQKYSNIHQYSPLTKKLIKEPNPKAFLFEHILKGDGSDGVPNILSPDDCFKEGIRQKPLTKKRKDVLHESIDDPKSVLTEDEWVNFVRNRKMIDLAYIPEDLVQKIIDTYENTKTASKLKIMTYLIKNRCRNLLECVGDFH
jgi:hypothetical protein